MRHKSGKNGGYKSILAVCAMTEDDGPLLEAAAGLAERDGAALSVMLSVRAPSDLRELARAIHLAADEIMARLSDEHRADLADHVARLLPGRDADVLVRLGKPFLDIIGHVISHDVDLVVRTAEPLGPGRMSLLASTDQHLLRKCPCPVWLRRPLTPKVPNCIIAAVDVDEAAADEPEVLRDLNIRVLSHAVRLAAGSEARITALHAWDAEGEGMVRLWATGPDARRRASDYVSDVETTRYRALHALIAGHADSSRLAPRLERGPASQVIPDAVAAEDADVLVIGTVARSGLSGIIIGNTAEDVLNRIDCSILAIKPTDFVSPLAGKDLS